MQASQALEKSFNEFFLNIKNAIREAEAAKANPDDYYVALTERDMALQRSFRDQQMAVHEAMCDNIDTVRVQPCRQGRRALLCDIGPLLMSPLPPTL